MTQSWPQDVFDRIHAGDPDPWKMETSDYERAKYAATLAALPRPRFHTALEAGCSIGVLTALLAERCDTLLAIDIAAEPVRRTAERCASLPHVTVSQAQIPQGWPPGSFDLIVLSEVLYFLDRTDLTETANRAADSLAPDGAIVLVNWTGDTNTPTTGTEAAELFIEASGLPQTFASTAPTYRLDVLRKKEERQGRQGAKDARRELGM